MKNSPFQILTLISAILKYHIFQEEINVYHYIVDLNCLMIKTSLAHSL